MNALDLTDTRNRNLGRILQLQAETRGDTVFLAQDERRITYAETDAITNRLARGLQDLGVGRGDRVAFFMASALEVIYLTLAVNKLGAVWVPINTEYKGEWLRDLLIDSQPKVIFSDTLILPRLAEVIDAVPREHVVILDQLGRDIPAWGRPFDALLAFSDAPLDLSLIQYGDVNSILWTSGTTGKSKGVMQSHNVWVASGERANRNYGLRPDDVTYNVLPMFNSAAWSSNIFRALVGGITCAIDPMFSVSHFWERTRYYGATQTFTLGAMHMHLWNAPPRPDDRDNPVRIASMVPMPDDLHDAFCARFGIEQINQGFGQSECTGVMSRVGKNKKAGALGTPGKELELRLIDDAGNEVAVGEVGEFALKPKVPHAMFEGYFNNPEATAAAFTGDGWYRMGDLGRRDEDGDYFFVDRKKDAVRYGGRNISTMEVEMAARRHPAVKEVAVFGIPSEELAAESELAMHIILKDGASATAEDIAHYINANAPYYFVPRYIEFVDSLPYTPTNKVQKYVLRERGITAATWDRKKTGFKLVR